MPPAIWVQYAQVLARDGYTVHRSSEEPNREWTIHAPDGRQYRLALEDDGRWRLRP